MTEVRSLKVFIQFSVNEKSTRMLLSTVQPGRLTPSGFSVVCVYFIVPLFPFDKCGTLEKGFLHSVIFSLTTSDFWCCFFKPYVFGGFSLSFCVVCRPHKHLLTVREKNRSQTRSILRHSHLQLTNYILRLNKEFDQAPDTKVRICDTWIPLLVLTLLLLRLTFACEVL